jgi:gamma-glutamylcyclotransferase (GGCT)/AIG2-like uncharacterized protein YtfP
MNTCLAGYETFKTGQRGDLPRALCRCMASLGSCRIPDRLYSVGDAYPALAPTAGWTVEGALFIVPAIDLPALDRYEGCDPADPADSAYCRLLAIAGPKPARPSVYVWNRRLRGLTRMASGVSRQRSFMRPEAAIRSRACRMLSLTASAAASARRPMAASTATGAPSSTAASNAACSAARES